MTETVRDKIAAAPVVLLEPSLVLDPSDPLPSARPVGPDAHRTQPHVHVGKADPEQAKPGPHHVATVQAADARVGRLPSGSLGQAVPAATDEVP